MSNSLIHTPEGVRDIYGKEYRNKLKVEEQLHSVISSYGYQDIQTPSFEFFDVFSRDIGTTPSRELFKFFDKDGDTLVLRPDFTPSMARCAAKYFMDETHPIRFCYAGNTFSNTSSLQGKLKEVTQLGAELIQDPSVEADAEMIAMTIEALLAAGLTEFQISIGEVEYFKGLCSQAGLDDDTENELRDLISSKNYFGAQELLTARGIRRDYCSILLKMNDLFGNREALEVARGLVKNERSLQAIERLESLYEVLCAYGMEQYVSFDLGLLSKYKYYTGIVFKAYTYGVGDAVAKGGRYDALLGYFGKKAPAIGFVIVVDDLMEALTRQKLLPQLPPEGALIVYEKEQFLAALKEARLLRQRSQPVELTKASQWASSGQIPDSCAETAAGHLRERIIYYAADGTRTERMRSDDGK